jgi:hypothetical protein
LALETSGVDFNRAAVGILQFNGVEYQSNLEAIDEEYAPIFRTQ